MKFSDEWVIGVINGTDTRKVPIDVLLLSNRTPWGGIQ